MCGRFTISVVISFYDRFRAGPPPFEIQPRYNIAPSQEVPIIVSAESPEREIKMMKWGLVPSWAKDTKTAYRMINARADSLIRKPAFMYNVQHHRCLVPATGFFEWKHEGPKRIPYLVRRKDGSLFAFAGLFDTWKGPDGISVSTFAIVTTDPNTVVAPLHDRMPAILSSDNEDTWLKPGLVNESDLMKILTPYPESELETYRVSNAVNNPDNESPEVIRKISERLW